MCGIAGIISANPDLVSQKRIEAGTASLKHRGPQNQGFYFSNGLALGHTRLCIIDLTERAAQPFHYMQRYHLVYNGELYNYVELKEVLIQKGFQFITDSDTEVVVAAYAAFGKECLQQFDGMFAFAIWDEKEKKFFAARDRFGEKPFFYYYDGQQFLFASEMKALWQMGISKEPNLAMLYNFLSIGYTSNPGDPQETFYQNIYKLPAASCLEFKPDGQEIHIEKYWHPDFEVAQHYNESHAIEKFSSLLQQSIKNRLRSDVEIGTSLSGGLDSSSIVALVASLESAPAHKCFTASFDGFEKDETAFAKMVADQFGLQHFPVSFNESDLPGLMMKMMAHQEEPISSSSPIAQYAVYAAARAKGVTVILDGQGADEILAGYHKYYRWYWQELYRQNRLASSKELATARALGIQQPFGWKQKAAALFPDFTAALWQSRMSQQAARNPDLHRDFAYSNKRNLYYTLPATPDLNGSLYFNAFVSGLEELLRLADRNSMAHSVEVRLPFLQHELVAFLFSLPPSSKIHQGWTKYLLRKSMNNRLPSEIVWRKDKTGFEPPQKQWMRNPMVQEAIADAKQILGDQKILSPLAVNKKTQPHEAHAAGSNDWRYWSASFLFR